MSRDEACGARAPRRSTHRWRQRSSRHIATCGGRDAPAGQPADREPRQLGGRRRDHIRVPVVPMRPERRRTAARSTARRRGTYTQVRADVGHTLGLTVRATDHRRTTAAYAPLAGLVAAPRRSPRPRRSSRHSSGEPIVGQGLKVRSAARWTAPPHRAQVRVAALQRERTALHDVGGARTDTLQPSRRRHRARAARGVSRAGQANGAQRSSRRRASGSGPSAHARPTIAGTLQSGADRLTGNCGTLVRQRDDPYAYQWYRCDAAARSAARCAARPKGTYTLVARRHRQDDRADRARDRLDGNDCRLRSLAGLVAPAKRRARAPVASPRSPASRPSARNSRSEPASYTASRHPSRTPGCGATRAAGSAPRSRARQPPATR